MTTNYDRRPVEPLKDAWLLDSTGKVVGVELSRASNQKTYLAGSATDSDVTLDTAAITAATITTATVTTANVTTENTTTANITTANVTTLNATGVSTISDPVGIFANQITVVSGTPLLTVDANGQAILYGPWTVQSTTGVSVAGEVRVF